MFGFMFCFIGSVVFSMAIGIALGATKGFALFGVLLFVLGLYANNLDIF